MQAFRAQPKVQGTNQARRAHRAVVCTAQAQHARSQGVREAAGRRGFMLGVFGLALTLPAQPTHALDLPNKEVDNDTSPWIQELLKRTDEKRDERREQRLKDYYKRNFKEYFEFEANSRSVASRRGIKPETQDAIAKWLQENQ